VRRNPGYGSVWRDSGALYSDWHLSHNLRLEAQALVLWLDFTRWFLWPLLLGDMDPSGNIALNELLALFIGFGFSKSLRIFGP